MIAFSEHECDNNADWDCDDWKDGDSKRGSMPERPLGIRWE